MKPHAVSMLLIMPIILGGLPGLDDAWTFETVDRDPVYGADAALDQAIALARDATRLQLDDADLAPLQPVPLPEHETPSQALAELASRHGITRFPAQAERMEAIDTTPEPLRSALTGFLDAFLALDAATRAGDPGEHPGSLEEPDLPLILAARDAFLSSILELSQSLPATELSNDCELVFSEPPAFRIDLSGCDDLIVQDYALVLDVGGNDRHYNNAGGSNLKGGVCWPPVGTSFAAALVDLGSGSDVFGRAGAGARRSCGANGGGWFGGSGFLLDNGGDDVYWGGFDGTNGGGAAGVGFLLDVTGDDHYSAKRRSTNGGAGPGSGLLLDATGTDTYDDHVVGTCTDCSMVPRGTLGWMVDASDPEALVESVEEKATRCEDRLPLGPIRIRDDTQFGAGPAVGVLNPHAEGTEEDPFVIAGWCITPSQRDPYDTVDSAGVLLEGTRAHVVVRDLLVAADLLTDPPLLYPQRYGVRLVDAENVTLENLTIVGHDNQGVRAEGVGNVKILESTIRSSGESGIVVKNSDNVTLTENILEGNQWGGMSITDTTGLDVLDNSVSDGWRGVSIRGTPSAWVTGNTLDGDYTGTIEVRDAPGTVVAGNSLTGRSTGINVRGSAGVNLLDNDLMGAYGFVDVRSSSGAVLEGNVVDGTNGGAMVGGSEDIRMTRNRLGSAGLVLDGQTLAEFHHSIDGTNTVDGKPLGYVRDATGYRVPESAGQVILVNTTQAVVDGLRFSDSSIGAQLAYASDTAITGTTISNNFLDGIRAWGSPGTVVDSSTVTGNTFSGMRLTGADRAVITNNVVSGNGADGIFLLESDGSDVNNNSARSNDGRGVRIDASSSTSVSDNTLSLNGGSAIWLNGADGSRISRNHAESNGAGISVTGSTGLQADNNTIRWNFYFTSGLHISNSEDISAIHNSITGNSELGVKIWGSRNVRILDNILETNWYHGVMINDGDEVQITGNNIRNNGSTGLYTSGGTDAVDARRNWWGAADGPDGGTADACTGTTAEGSGDRVIAFFGGEVCFEPWRTTANPDAGVH